MLTVADRTEIAVGRRAGMTVTAIAEQIGRDKSIVSREIKRNATKAGTYRVIHADKQAKARRARPQTRTIDTDSVLAERVRSDLRASRTPRQIAGRLKLESED
ncbi:transposase, partial [Gordonia alkaliphila]